MNPKEGINSRAWWDAYFDAEWERHGGPDQTRHFVRRIIEELPAIDRALIAEHGYSILDWGCAFGDGTAELARSFPNASVTGIEISSTALAHASACYPDLQFLLADETSAAGALPRPFDIVVNSNALEHFTQPFDVLRANLAGTRLLHISLVPYEEEPLSVHHCKRFDDHSFPAAVGEFRRILNKVIDVDPRYWPSGRQLLVAYASREYEKMRGPAEALLREREKWDSYYDSLPILEIDPRTKAFNDELVQVLTEILPPGARILEAGCGGGNQSLALAQAGFDVTLLDFSQAALDYARRSFERHGLHARFVHDDAFAQRNAEYDLVFNAGVLEHYELDEQARFLRGMASRSRRYVLALIPNRGCYWYWLWRIRKASAGDWPFGKEVPQTTLADAFAAAGLAYVGERYLGAAWTEDFIESFTGIDDETRRLLIELHRSPAVPSIGKGYLLAALGSVETDANHAAGWTNAHAAVDDVRRSETWAATVADALASAIAGENRLRLHQTQAAEELRSTRQHAAEELEATRQHAAEELEATRQRAAEELETARQRAAEALRDEQQRTEQEILRREQQIAHLRIELADGATQLETSRQEVQSARNDLQAAREFIDQLQRQVQQLGTDLHAVHSSRGWRFVLFVRAMRQRYLPRGSRREWLARRVFGLLRRTYRALKPVPAAPSAAPGHQKPEADLPPPLVAPQVDRPTAVAPDPDYRPRPRQYAVIVLPIIDYGFRFQRPQQVAKQFALAGHPVFYVALNFGAATESQSVAPGIEEIRLAGPSLNPYRDRLDRDTAARMTAELLRLIRARAIGASVCLVQLPFWQPLAEALREEGGIPVVYDCMDEHAGFSTNTAAMVSAEETLIGQADLCIASSALLQEKLTAHTQRSLLIRNAADYEHFSQVPWQRHDSSSTLIVGYYGAIADWFDSALVAQIARLRPNWRIKLVGSTFSADLTPFEGLANVEFLGEQPYAQLPQLIQDWACFLIPFKRNALTDATNPVKAYEMLATGKPVVAVELPELAPMAQHGLVDFAATAAEFVAGITDCVKGDHEALAKRRREFAAGNTWRDRFEALDQAVRALFPLVSIVVVTYNNERLNRLCLTSLQEDTDWPNIEVIVVDNGSTDGTPSMLRQFEASDPRIHVVLSETNLGFAAGNNRGAALARGEYLCLLNNDTVVTGAWLTSLVKHLMSHPDLGIVGPVTNAIGNEAQIAVGYSTLADMPAWADQWSAAHRGQLADIPMLAFFCVVLRRALWEKIGGLDERFGKGMFEDDDYNRRVREAGLRVQLAKDAFVHHWQKASFRLLGEEEYKRIYHENRRRYRTKWNESSAVPPEISAKLAPLVARATAARGTVIFPPSVGWSIDLFQRPHHLARVLAQDGYAVVFDCSTSYDDVDVVKQLEPGLFLFKGESEWLGSLPRLVLWTFSYNYDYRDRYPSSARVIYDWIDDLAVFPYDQNVLRELHARALSEADVVASVARPLHEQALRERADAIYLPNAVEAGRFDREPTPNPARSDPEVARILASGKPIAGYYGALAEWFDYDLLVETARLRPDWEFLLIGPDYDQSIVRSRLKQCGNVTWVGPRKYHELPGYLHLFTVAMIPFRINDITVATSPLKLYEYFAGGKPVISTPMPECAAYAPVHVVSSAAEFSSALDTAHAEADRPEAVRALRQIAQANTWKTRAELALATLEERSRSAGEQAAQAAVIAERFAALRCSSNRHFFAALAKHFRSIPDDPCLPMYFEFALSANERGRKAADEIERHVKLKGKRCLDIGCAYGGFLVAFGERGARPLGIDINPLLLGLARENFKDAGRDYEVLLKDITRAADVATLGGPFDVITCNDVIEHVADPATTIRHIAGLLAPDGVAFFEIPNKDAATAVAADGHYRMFGITQFDRDEAARYFAAANRATAYSVEHYLRLQEYRTLFQQCGLTLEVLPDTWSAVSRADVESALDLLRSERDFRLATVPPEWQSRVREKVDDYLAEAETNGRSPANSDIDFILRYGVTFWKILARKSRSS